MQELQEHKWPSLVVVPADGDACVTTRFTRRHAIGHVEIIELPRPRDSRDLFDFSGARELIDSAYTLSMAKLDEYERELVAAREAAEATAATDALTAVAQRLVRTLVILSDCLD